LSQRHQPKHGRKHNAHSNATDGVSPAPGSVAQIFRHPFQSPAPLFVLFFGTLFFPLPVILFGPYFAVLPEKPSGAGRETAGNPPAF